MSLKSLISYIMINQFCSYLEKKSRRLLDFVQQMVLSDFSFFLSYMGTVRFFLLFEQYGVKIWRMQRFCLSFLVIFDLLNPNPNDASAYMLSVLRLLSSKLNGNRTFVH